MRKNSPRNFSIKKAVKTETFEQRTIVKFGQLPGELSSIVSHSEGEISTPYFIKFSRATLPLEII
jgi:hypothetical protein